MESFSAFGYWFAKNLLLDKRYGKSLKYYKLRIESNQKGKK